MTFAFRPLLVAIATVACASGASAATAYTDSATFLGLTAPGRYTETFTGGVAVTASASFLAGGFGYTLTSTGGSTPIYRNGEFIGNTYGNQSLTVTFTAGNPTAIGGNFYISDIDDLFVAAPVTINLSDGTTATFIPSGTATGSYRGFIATVPITSLVLSAPGTLRYNSIDNFTVGVAAAVPEPASGVLMALGVAGLLAVRRRAQAG
jgi:hypothetical protein